MALDLYSLKISAEKAELINGAIDAIEAATAAIQAITPNLSNFNLVAENLTEIDTAASNILSINTLATIVDNINSLAADKAKLDSLFADKAKLDSLYADKAKLYSLYADKAELDAIFASMDDIGITVANLTEIDTAASNILSINTLATIVDNINSLAADKAKLDSLFADKAKLDSLYADKAKLYSLYADKAELDAIFASLDDIGITVANLTDIQSANINAQNAKLQAWIAEAKSLTSDSYANQSEDVFVNIYTSNGDGTFTATPTTEYSAYHWKQKAKEISNISIEALSDVDTSGKIDKSSLIYDLSSNKWIPSILTKEVQKLNPKQALSISGNVLTLHKADGSSENVTIVPEQTINYSSQEFLTSGIFTVPSGVTYVYVCGSGGGGGGGGVAATNNYGPAQGSGGGGAGLFIKKISVTPVDDITVTIGSGGAGARAKGYDGGKTERDSYSVPGEDAGDGGSTFFGTEEFPGGKGAKGAIDGRAVGIPGEGGGFPSCSGGSGGAYDDDSNIDIDATQGESKEFWVYDNGVLINSGYGVGGKVSAIKNTSSGGGGASAFGNGGDGVASSSDGTPGNNGGIGAGGSGGAGQSYNSIQAAGGDGGPGYLKVWWPN